MRPATVATTLISGPGERDGGREEGGSEGGKATWRGWGRDNDRKRVRKGENDRDTEEIIVLHKRPYYDQSVYPPSSLLSSMHMHLSALVATLVALH